MAAINICLFLLLIPYSCSLTFDFTKISPKNQNHIVTEGDGAYISEGGIQVTPDGIGSDRNEKAGRATYNRSLHIWDKTSRELADFTTDFSFVIDSDSRTEYGYGLTFFLAEKNSVIATGGSMGLPVNLSNVMMNPFVAVEFDTYFNDQWDPIDSTNNYIGNHVGININSLTSVTYQKWLNNLTDGREWQARIKYDSVSKTLSVFINYEDDTFVQHIRLYCTVDLRDVLPEWVIFGFSAATGAFFQKNNIKSWAFNSSELKIDNNNMLPPTVSPPAKEIDDNNGIPPTISPIPTKGKSRKRYVVGLIVVLCMVLVTFLVVLALLVWRKKKKGTSNEVEEQEFNNKMNNNIEMTTWPKTFSYHELAQATASFGEKLGEGGFGGVYKGFFEDSSTYVAVKRVSKSSKQGIKEYASEVTIISQLRHKNLVQLTGWCHENEELLLVYEYMENGSLDSHLFKAKSLLTWETRYKIALGLASALLYLHEEWVHCVLHRDIKSSNVLLDSNFNAKLGDFGLAKLVDHEKGWQTTMQAGTMGYLAPECAYTGKASKESDVFSFGVVALEIACGRKIVEYKAEENETNLVEWVWGLYGTGTLLEATDPLLGSDFVKEEIERLMSVGLWCANPDANCRPTMKHVIQVLNFDASLPPLPLTMPVATYFSPPVFLSYSVTSNPQSKTSSRSHKTNSSKHITSLSTSSSSPSVSLLLSV